MIIYIEQVYQPNLPMSAKGGVTYIDAYDDSDDHEQLWLSIVDFKEKYGITPR